MDGTPMLPTTKAAATANKALGVDTPPPRLPAVIFNAEYFTSTSQSIFHFHSQRL
jgi:hypothetical protein